MSYDIEGDLIRDLAGCGGDARYVASNYWTYKVWESEEEKAEFLREKTKWMTDHDYRHEAMRRKRREHFERELAMGYIDRLPLYLT